MTQFDLSALQVVMLFEEDFWGSTDMFGRLAPSTAERGKFFLFYSYTGISGQHADFALTSFSPD